MNTTLSDSNVPVQKEKNIRHVVLALYIMYIAGLFTAGLSFFVALILAHVKKSASMGTIYQSHIVSFLKVVWINIAVFFSFPVGFSLYLYFGSGYAPDTNISTFSFLAWLCASIIVSFWSLYRIAKGVRRWFESRAVI